MKITILEKNTPETGDMLIMTPLHDSTLQIVRLIISNGGYKVGLLDLEDGEITTCFYENFDQLNTEVLKNVYTYKVVPKSQLKLIIHK